MMLELADQYFVTGFEVGRTPALGDEVDPLGRAPYEDDLALIRCVQKRADLLARFLEQLGRPGAQPVNPAMHVRVIGAVIIRDPVDDGARLLRAGAGIEEHQTGVARENRELAL